LPKGCALFIEKVGCVRPPFSAKATTGVGLARALAALALEKVYLLPLRLHGTTHGERRRHLSVLTVRSAKMRSLVSHYDRHQNLPWSSRMRDRQRWISNPIQTGAQTACLAVIHICQYLDTEAEMRKCEQGDFRV